MIYNIVITGGPCAGKTSSLKRIKDNLENDETIVLLVRETATDVISAGAIPNEYNNILFHYEVMKLQIAKELFFNNIAIQNPSSKVFVIYDRALMDNKSYVDDEEFAEICEKLELKEGSILSRYDAVFHLQSVAGNISEVYTLENNNARYGTEEDAYHRDRRTFNVWKGHKDQRFIQCKDKLEDKIESLVEEIMHFASMNDNTIV